MSQSPFISVIVPVYNVERYIKICINSILAQTFQDFEIVLVDDASPDNSYKICTELYGSNEKIRIFRHEKNLGLGSARNTGIANAKGKYIYFVDGDAIIFPNALEKIFKTSQIAAEVDAIHFKGWYNTLQIDNAPIDLKNLRLSWEDRTAEGFLTENIPRRLAENWLNNPVANFWGSTVLKRDIFKEINFKIQPPTAASGADEKIFMLAAMCFAKKFLCIRDSICIKRLRPHTSDIIAAINVMPIVSKCVEEILSKVPELEHNRTFKDQCLMKNFDDISAENILPFYGNPNIPPELDTAVYQTLLPTFKENTLLMKYFFHGFHVMRRQNYSLTMQNKFLVNRINQLNQLLSLYTNENRNLNKLLDEVNKAEENIRKPFESLCGASYEYIESFSQVLPRNIYDSLIDRIFAATVKKIRAKEKIKIAFVTYNAAMWCGDDLYNMFAENPRYDVKVFLSVDFSKGNSPAVKRDWQRGVEQFKARGINVTGLDSLNATIDKQDVIIFLNPYLETFPYSLRLAALTAETLLVNIPYAFDSSGLDIYNLPVFHVIWKHFFDTKLHMTTQEKNSKVAVHGCYSGYPRLDCFFDKNFEPKFDWKMTRPDAVKIIYAPHWSIDDRGVKYATFQHNCKFFYEYAKAHQEISWVIKPHPNLFKSAAETGLFPSEGAFENYMKAWDNLPNAKVVTGAYYHDIFATSDGMILDSGSFIGEYQYTHKPMIFLTRDTQNFNDVGKEIMEVTYRVDGRDLDGIAQMIQKVFVEGKDEMYQARHKVFEKYCDYVKANGMKASEYIYKNISNEFNS